MTRDLCKVRVGPCRVQVLVNARRIAFTIPGKAETVGVERRLSDQGAAALHDQGSVAVQHEIIEIPGRADPSEKATHQATHAAHTA
jgi:hypothetical protein